jgi:uncharacterized membrane protein YbaN (DUF454 family)
LARFIVHQQQEVNIMKLSTIAMATAFALSSTFAFAQSIIGQRFSRWLFRNRPGNRLFNEWSNDRPVKAGSECWRSEIR